MLMTDMEFPYALGVLGILGVVGTGVTGGFGAAGSGFGTPLMGLSLMNLSPEFDQG
jgi:hypothetical protein